MGLQAGSSTIFDVQSSAVDCISVQTAQGSRLAPADAERGSLTWRGAMNEMTDISSLAEVIDDAYPGAAGRA